MARDNVTAVLCKNITEGGFLYCLCRRTVIFLRFLLSGTCSLFSTLPHYSLPYRSFWMGNVNNREVHLYANCMKTYAIRAMQTLWVIYVVRKDGQKERWGLLTWRSISYFLFNWNFFWWLQWVNHPSRKTIQDLMFLFTLRSALCAMCFTDLCFLQ